MTLAALAFSRGFVAQAADAEASPRIQAEHFDVTNPAPLRNGIFEGGLSGLMHLPGDQPDVLYTLCDRGANGKLGSDGDPRMGFADPGHGPTIYKLKLTPGQARIIERIPILLPEGQLNPLDQGPRVSGLPNLDAYGEAPYDATGQTQLPYDPHGLDTEGLAFGAADRTFWICEEYSPSIVQLGMDGRIIRRLVPQGLAARLGTPYAVDALPAVYARRQPNRGFEGVAVTPSGRYLYAVLQSPLENPDRATALASRILRVIKLDLTTGQPVAEFAYAREEARPLGIRQNQIVVSDLYALDEDRLIVDERDLLSGKKARIKRLYIADFSKAGNVLGQLDAAGDDGRTLEQHTPESLAERGIAPAPKRLLIDLLALDMRSEKIEGVCLLDPSTVAIVNDNDFGFEFEQGAIVPSGQPSQVSLYRFPTPIQ